MDTTTTGLPSFLLRLPKYTALLFFVISIFCSTANAQNLIPNPSFELRDSCPSGWHEGFPFISNGASFAQNWYMPSVGTADYFNACSPVTPAAGLLPVSVPVNLFGYQQPRTGQAYAGTLIERAGNEYVESPLLSPTIYNHRYFISYWLSLADYSSGACDLFGAYASKDSLEMPTTLFLDLFTPQVESPPASIILDSLGWTQVAGTYVSEGNERWLTIGCFHTTSALDTIQFVENMGFGYGPMYYFYDDVCMLDLDGAPSEFTVSDSTLCGNPSLMLNGRAEADNFYWSDGTSGFSLNITGPGTYWVKSIDVNSCIFYTDTIHVKANATGMSLDIGTDTSVCTLQPITLKAKSGNFERFQWSTGSTKSSIEVTSPGSYSLTAFSACESGSDTIKIDLRSDCTCLFVPNAFSPNNDGLNDYLKVGSLCPIDYFFINIYNRFGESVFSANNPSEGWNGSYKGLSCDAGTYFYNIHYAGKNAASDIQEQRGDITLLR